MLCINYRNVLLSVLFLIIQINNLIFFLSIFTISTCYIVGRINISVITRRTKSHIIVSNSAAIVCIIRGIDY